MVPNGSGADAYTITPSTPGTYVYTVTATDADFGCVSIGTVSIVVSANPVVDSVKANRTTICAGTSVTLNAYSSAPVSGSQVLPTGYCSPTGSTGACISAVSFNTLSNSTGCSTGSPYYTNYPSTTTTTNVNNLS